MAMTTSRSAGSELVRGAEVPQQDHRWRTFRERAPIIGMMAPALLVFGVFMILPMIMTFGLSFTPSGFVPTGYPLSSSTHYILGSRHLRYSGRNAVLLGEMGRRGRIRLSRPDRA